LWDELIEACDACGDAETVDVVVGLGVTKYTCTGNTVLWKLSWDSTDGCHWDGLYGFGDQSTADVYDSEQDLCDVRDITSPQAEQQTVDCCCGNLPFPTADDSPESWYPFTKNGTTGVWTDIDDACLACDSNVETFTFNETTYWKCSDSDLVWALSYWTGEPEDCTYIAGTGLNPEPVDNCSDDFSVLILEGEEECRWSNRTDGGPCVDIDPDECPCCPEEGPPPSQYSPDPGGDGWYFYSLGLYLGTSASEACEECATEGVDPDDWIDRIDGLGEIYYVCRGDAVTWKLSWVDDDDCEWTGDFGFGETANADVYNGSEEFCELRSVEAPPALQIPWVCPDSSS